MPTRWYAARGPVVLSVFVAFALVFLQTGCEIKVEGPQGASKDGEQVAMSTSTTPLPQYSVSISAIDFDPPLKSDNLLKSQQPVTLVAAVENKGTAQLTQLTVVAQVSSQRGEYSARDQVQVDKLSPGETKVVKFKGVAPLAELPKSPSYRISVSVDSPQLDPAVPRPSRVLTVKVADQ